MKKIILSCAAALVALSGFAQQQESNEYRRSERPREAVRWMIDTTSTERDTIWFDADGNRIEADQGSENYRPMEQAADTLEQDMDQASDTLQQDVEEATRETQQNIRNEADTTEQAGREVIQEMERAGNELEQDAEKTGDTLQEEAERKESEVENKVEETGEDIKQGAQQTGNELRRSAEQTDEAVRTGVDSSRPSDTGANAEAESSNSKGGKAPDVEVVEGKEGPNNEVVYKFQGEMWYVDRAQKKMVKAKESDLKDTDHKIMVHEGTSSKGKNNKRSRG